jgi:hypothetical protein
MYSFFGTGLYTIWFFVIVLAKITLEDPCPRYAIRLDVSVGAAHNAHKASTAALLVILHMTGGGLFL